MSFSIYHNIIHFQVNSLMEFSILTMYVTTKSIPKYIITQKKAQCPLRSYSSFSSCPDPDDHWSSSFYQFTYFEYFM